MGKIHQELTTKTPQGVIFLAKGDAYMAATKEQAADIAKAILVNLASEAKARRLQQKLLGLPGLDSADMYTVREISSDETNHALLYEAMYKKYTGIAAAPDGMRQALAEITAGIKGGDE